MGAIAAAGACGFGGGGRSTTCGADAHALSSNKLERDLGYLFPSQKGTPYTKRWLFSMWDRARERAGITDSVWFKDLRALGATGALKAGEGRKGIQTRLAHTSEKTAEIYLKEAVAEASGIVLALPWKAV